MNVSQLSSTENARENHGSFLILFFFHVGWIFCTIAFVYSSEWLSVGSLVGSCGSYQPNRLSLKIFKGQEQHVMSLVTLFAWSVCSSEPSIRNDAHSKETAFRQHNTGRWVRQLLGRLLFLCRRLSFSFFFLFATPTRVILMLVPFQLVQWQFSDFLCGFTGVVRNMVNT